MRGRQSPQGAMFSYVSLEERIPAKHPLRTIRTVVDTVLTGMDAAFAKLYTTTGRPSIPPEQVLKALLLQAFYTIRSERQLIEQLDFNLLFRWFVGLGVDDPVWHSTVFTKNRDRLLAGDVAHAFLGAVVAHAKVKGLLSDEHFSVDGTQIEAWASMKSFRPKDGGGEPPGPGRNGERNFHGEQRSNDTHVSVTDPEARLFRKGPGKEAKLSFMGHMLMENRNGLVVGATLTQASGTAERSAALDLIGAMPGRHRITVGGDKGYDTADFVADLRTLKATPHMAQNTSRRRSRIPVDKINVAIYPPAASARRGLLAREFVGYLGSLAGREKVHELRVWADTGTVSPGMRRLPASIPMEEIESAVAALGGYYPGGEVRRYHAALNFLRHKHFVILAGLSGTGKTQLALKYALAVHGVTSDDPGTDPFLVVCPVRPEWTDPTGLTGYYDVLSNRYNVPPFLGAVLLATAHRDTPVFVVLDEMNLARVEYYLSDVLSCMETRKELKLHDSGVPLEGTTGTSVPAELPLPPNLFITGTINIDETTNPVSDKVLDRAHVIDMSAVDLAGFLAGLEAREPDLKDARAACEDHLLAAQGIMTLHGLGFGYRVAEEVVRYHAFAAEHLKAVPGATTDDLMVQKILVKLRGAERQRPLLAGLTRELAGLPRSLAFLKRLNDDLDEFGSFQASR